jgi:hypothetical protein
MIDAIQVVKRLLDESTVIQETIGGSYFARGLQGDAEAPYLLYHPITSKPGRVGDRVDYFQLSVRAMDSVDAEAIKNAVVDTFNRVDSQNTPHGAVKRCIVETVTTSQDPESKLLGYHITIKIVFNDQNF